MRSVQQELGEALAARRSPSMNIRYQHTFESVADDHLHGFFVGWPQPPSPAEET
jgi:hypothetical protein